MPTYHRFFKFTLTLVLIHVSFSAQSASLQASDYAQCQICHARKEAPNASIPPLLGPKHELESQLLDFKYDRRQGTIMGRIAKGYTDEELKAMAAYFATQPKGQTP